MAKIMRNGRPHCLDHDCDEPCPVCILNSLNISLFHNRERRRQELKKEATDQWYIAAHVQGLSQVPEIGDFRALDAQYDTEKYRHEINLGLRYARSLISDLSIKYGDGLEGRDDLKQIVDIEIWKAYRHYKEEMNEAIAYTIAKNQAMRFIGKQINERTVPLEKSDGTPVLDEFRKQKRISRCHGSFDDRPKDEHGREQETSRFDLQVASGVIPISSLGHEPEPEMSLRTQIEINAKMIVLERLVRSWYGNKKKVGEAILKNPEVTVREIGIPKSTAARIRTVVLDAFRVALLNQALSTD